MTNATPLSEAAVKMLRVALDPGLNRDSKQLHKQTGMSGVVAKAVLGSLQKKSLIDSNWELTAAGREALNAVGAEKPPVKTNENQKTDADQDAA